MRYFHCDPGHGIFIAANKISKAGKGYKPVDQREIKRSTAKPVVNHGRVDVSHVQAKFHSAMAVIAERSELRIGDRVDVKEVDRKRVKGFVRFIGSVVFVEDTNVWYGVELDSPVGRHDGTVQGVRYFAAGKDRGVFVTKDKIERVDDDEIPVSPSSSIGGELDK